MLNFKDYSSYLSFAEFYYPAILCIISLIVFYMYAPEGPQFKSQRMQYLSYF